MDTSDGLADSNHPIIFPVYLYQTPEWRDTAIPG